MNKDKEINLDTKNSFIKTKAFSIVNVVLTVLCHVSIVVLVVLSFQYYTLSKVTAICILGFIVCLLIILDFLLFVGNNYNDKVVKIINCVLATIILAGGIFGDVMMYKLTSSVNKVIDNSGVEQYENISVSFVSYKTEYKELKEIDGKLVGVLYETNVGTSSLGKTKIEESEIECDYIECSSINDLFFGLIEGKFDVAILPGSYRQLYESSDDADYTEYLEEMYDFYNFEENVLVDENENANKDLSDEAFNILLIGFAQNSPESSYGLADTIILATVNPQTMTVSMTSIARDSYVPISCYGGAKDKINAARGTSRACLMETVSNLLDVPVDFYMEVNFQGLVDIVDALGGIYIDSPVEFIGQSSSVERGHMNVKVFAGGHIAQGEEVLAFCRERHAMPNGDFDRQKHQKEVIAEIAKTMINTRDINKVLKVMEACGDNISTNLSISQLTRIFNYIISVPNYQEISQFDLIDMESLRITGYSSWHYSDQLELPLWIYRLYNGSISETKDYINEVLGNFDTIDQSEGIRFFELWPYYRGDHYSLTFDEKEEHETLPLYCLNLTNMTYSQVRTWANANGLKLDVTFVNTGYDSSMSGMVVAQSTRYGKKLSAGDTVSITIFGLDPELQIPDFTGKLLSEVKTWAKEHNYSVTVQEVTENIKGLGGTVIEQTPAAGSAIEDYTVITVKHYAYASVDVSNLKGKTKEEAEAWAKENLYYPEAITYVFIVTSDESQVGQVVQATFSSGTISTTNDKSLKISIYVRAQNFNVTVVANDSSMGSVSGGGSLSNAKTWDISASPHDGYKFVGWYIGSEKVSKEKTISICPSSDVTYTAKFEALASYSVTISSNDSSMGSVSPESATVVEGGSVSITATPNEGYRFVRWSDDNGESSRNYYPSGDVNLVAYFEAIPTEN